MTKMWRGSRSSADSVRFAGTVPFFFPSSTCVNSADLRRSHRSDSDRFGRGSRAEEVHTRRV
eukprot:1727049-Rhodomonas_salina.1